MTFAKTFFLGRSTTLQTAVKRVNEFAAEHGLELMDIHSTHNYVIAVYSGERNPDVDSDTE